MPGVVGGRVAVGWVVVVVLVWVVDVWARFFIAELSILAIYRTLTLQNLRDGIPVTIIVFDAVFLHPFRDCNVRASHHVAHSVKILPEGNIESVTYAGMQTDSPTRRKIVVGMDILILEIRQYYCHLSIQRFRLHLVIRILWLWFQEALQYIRFRRATFDTYRIFTASLMLQELREVRF